MRKKRLDNVVHVSDIIPTTCIRKQYYCMKFPEMDSISNKSVHHFVRGESSEFIITQVTKMRVAQADIEMANDRDILDINGVVDVNPLIDSSFI